ncbi:sigma-70 family RNA polymerase sigma factor [Glaciihabitans sp. INWT7]|uniref:sigma-70 family RNA polymerase sigma factor n=1 Tax=Glaciihabitans sp. INWT7 TaxID=2596912 RepID=UPI0016242B6F|nr:sigma-70 family RNA polymerase sigma factor [Glaciihabitans sp. INWT7]QNE45939.1 sigma-70 family RNA polymerase sigma factor [Glaciihabitans sp. INWT7]
MEHEEAEGRGVPGTTASDESLVALARAGDRSAFAQLWQRHARSGLRVARQFTSSIDADDLVSEAYARIYQRVLAGGGPDGAFRPYLYTTIRNLASRWGGDRHDVNVDDIGDFEDPRAVEDPAAIALDRTLTVRAFRALPERWRSVLWYTEVEGMDPHEVAPILGLTANGVAALSYRAREGLRKAWLQAHVSDATASGECQWAIARLGDFARNGLTARERTRVSDHLETCARCSIISEEVEEVGSHLALVLLPLLLGGIAGGGLLASLSTPATAVAATLTPALPPAFVVGSGAVAAPTVAAGLTASAIAAPLIGTLAVAMVVSGGLAASNASPVTPAPVSTSISQPADTSTAPSSTASSSTASSWTVAHWPAISTTAADARGLADGFSDGLPPLLRPIGTTLDGTVSQVGMTVDGLVTDLTNPVNSLIPGVALAPGEEPAHSAPAGVVGVASALDLSGTGVPGATVSLQAAGIVYATTKVTPAGTWAIHLTALPAATVGLQLKQSVLGLLGIDLDMPLRVLSNSLGVGIDILGL